MARLEMILCRLIRSSSSLALCIFSVVGGERVSRHSSYLTWLPSQMGSEAMNMLQ
jgi:hypothetical protein